jgi:hypothetical protein
MKIFLLGLISTFASFDASPVNKAATRIVPFENWRANIDVTENDEKYKSSRKKRSSAAKTKVKPEENTSISNQNGMDPAALARIRTLPPFDHHRLEHLPIVNIKIEYVRAVGFRKTREKVEFPDTMGMVIWPPLHETKREYRIFELVELSMMARNTYIALMGYDYTYMPMNCVQTLLMKLKIYLKDPKFSIPFNSVLIAEQFCVSRLK